MQQAKEEIRKILDQLPDDATLDDIQYHIYVRQKIDRGLDDVAQGRVLTEEEFDLAFIHGARDLAGLLMQGQQPEGMLP